MLLKPQWNSQYIMSCVAYGTLCNSMVTRDVYVLFDHCAIELKSKQVFMSNSPH